MKTIDLMLRLLVGMTLFAGLSGASAAAGLDLSPAQKAAMRALSRSTEQQTEVIRQALADRRFQLLRLYGEYSLNTDRARSLNREINEQQLRLLNVNLDSQLGVRGILSREQFAQFAQLMQRPRPGRGFRGMLEDEKEARFGPRDVEPLGLSSPQHGRIKRLLQSSKEHLGDAINKIRAKSLELETLYGNYDLDEARARVLIRELNAAQMQLLDARLQLQTELRQVLTEDQFNRLREAMGDRLKKMGQRHFGRPGPPR